MLRMKMGKTTYVFKYYPVQSLCIMQHDHLMSTSFDEGKTSVNENFPCQLLKNPWFYCLALLSCIKVLYPKHYKHWLHTLSSANDFKSILTQKVHFKANWHLFHFYFNKIFSADATMCTNSILYFLGPWKHEKIPSKVGCFNKIKRISITAKIGLVCKDSWKSFSMFFTKSLANHG